ncbi:MAG: hypothetical protein PHV82_08680 [Victivallaceae bacterium]|nr:hypothetical protein [Victivallaceae bacterium]
MNKEFIQFLERYKEDVQTVLNVLTESAYFYCTDNENIFYFLRQHESVFAEFFRVCFNWELITNDKCARLFKDKIYNNCRENRLVMFQLKGRDEYIAFMLMLEFYEKLLDQNNMTVGDRENPHFRFGELLEFQRQRFCELFPEREELRDAEYIRKNILRELMPKLCNYRFLYELKRPDGERISHDRYIYEALPALHYYNSEALEQSIKEGAWESSASAADIIEGEDIFEEGEEDGSF